MLICAWLELKYFMLEIRLSLDPVIPMFIQ